MSERTYKVSGKWPFPLDMLRYDESHPTSSEDTILIVQLSGEHCPNDISLNDRHEISLATGSRYSPNKERWKSFSWEVLDV